MANLDQELADVERLIRAVQPADAEARLQALISTMGDDELSAWQLDIRQVIKRFLPKRQRSLDEALSRRLRKERPNEVAVADAPVVPPTARPDVIADLKADLSELSNNHIFQWATFYRDYLGEAFDVLFDLAVHQDEPELTTDLRTAFADHTIDIFRKGYHHTVSRAPEGPQYAITKSLGGLQRFLDIPIEIYSAKLTAGIGGRPARALRELASSMLTGILIGYSSVQFGGQRGLAVLPRYPRSWAHTLPFLSYEDLRSILHVLEPGDFRDSVRASVLPFVRALDDIGANGDDYVPLPALSQVSWPERRLDVGLHPPPQAANPQLIDAQCYLDPAFVRGDALVAAARRDAGVILAPIRPDLRSALASDERVSRIVVSTGDEHDTAERIAHRCAAVLNQAIFRRRSARLGQQPLRYNFAREFPLHNPFLTRYFHVTRSSVRELLRAFEKRNGARLWCSVRRSGKTTGCLDLGTSSGTSTIVTQTCDSTGQIPEGNLIYEAVCERLELGRQLPPSFVIDAVRRAAPDSGSRAERFILVLDEYETLFGRLRGAVRRDPDVRYAVVQPLLNQMVEFARDHLLVFLGQQPNAHYILMDQNQLSPYIEQDPFPLFRHDPGLGSSEFAELVRRVLTDRITLSDGFVEAVFAETAGHPFLTVNLLIEIVDWLIDTERKVSELRLGPDDFETFASVGLKHGHLSLSPEYQFFREAIAEALSDDGRVQTPWLHAIYTCLREMCTGRGALGCSRRHFTQIVQQKNLHQLGFSPERLLSTGSQSNFMDYNDARVWPRIRLLGRIAAVTQAGLSA